MHMHLITNHFIFVNANYQVKKTFIDSDTLKIKKAISKMQRNRSFFL